MFAGFKDQIKDLTLTLIPQNVKLLIQYASITASSLLDSGFPPAVWNPAAGICSGTDVG